MRRLVRFVKFIVSGILCQCGILSIHCIQMYVCVAEFCGLMPYAGIDLLARRKTVHEMQRPNPGHEEMSRHLPRRAGRRDSH